VGEISPEMLLDLFHDWIARCENVVATDGNYFEETIKWWFLFCIIPFSGRYATLGAEHLGFIHYRVSV
jgi:hypothetical protein